MEVRQMLVIDRVVFDVVKEIEEVRHLGDEDAIVTQKRIERASDFWQPGDVGQHVVPHDDLRGPALCAESLGDGYAEEVVPRLEASRVRGGREIPRGLHAESADAASHQRAKEDAALLPISTANEPAGANRATSSAASSSK